jgi:hypothetical protein
MYASSLAAILRLSLSAYAVGNDKLNKRVFCLTRYAGMIQRKMPNNIVVANIHVSFLLTPYQGAKSAVALVFPSGHLDKETAAINFTNYTQRLNVLVE